jgi:hypothetical protein
LVQLQISGKRCFLSAWKWKCRAAFRAGSAVKDSGSVLFRIQILKSLHCSHQLHVRFPDPIRLPILFLSLEFGHERGCIPESL